MHAVSQPSPVSNVVVHSALGPLPPLSSSFFRYVRPRCASALCSLLCRYVTWCSLLLGSFPAPLVPALSDADPRDTKNELERGWASRLRETAVACQRQSFAVVDCAPQFDGLFDCLIVFFTVFIFCVAASLRLPRRNLTA